MSEHVEKWKKLGKVNYCELGGFEAVGVKGQAPVAYVVPQHADLLAAAPELLARLELAVRYLEHPDVQAIPFAASAAGCAELCRAAIAKAKG